MKEHKWYLLTYPDGAVSACYTCDPEYFLHCEDCDIVGDLNQGEIERRLSRLTLAEAALSAAGELLELSSYPTEHDSPYCYHCPTTADDDPDVHAADCPYHQAKAQWDAALDALKP